jgi:adenylate cyclase
VIEEANVRNLKTQSPKCAEISIGNAQVVPRGIARAIRFMRDNLAEHLSIDAIAKATGITERTLRRQFRRFTGQSPIEFFRNLRLDAARHALRADNIDTDVTAAAAGHSFSHFGHFAAQYQRRFGELPSDTLRAGRETLVRLPPQAAQEPVALAILPFVPADEGCEQTAFACAMTDGVISALGRIRWLDVQGPDVTGSHQIGAHSYSTFPQRPRFAVRGRVRLLGRRVQVTVRLFEVGSQRHIWGDAFEGAPEHALELQGQVIEATAGTLPAYLRDAETTHGRRRPARDPAAVDLATRALHAASQITQPANARALEDLDRALTIDPEFPLAMALTAWCNAQRVVCCFTNAPDVERDKGRSLTALALSMDNNDSLVLAVLGTANTIFGDLDLGEALIRKSLAIDPHCSLAWQRHGWIAIYRGANTAVADFTRCLKLNPRGPETFNNILGISQAHFLAGHYDQAADWAVRGMQERPSETWACRFAAVAQARCGQTAEARHNVALLRNQYPDVTVGTIVNALPMQAELLARTAEALESAGLPV